MFEEIQHYGSIEEKTSGANSKSAGRINGRILFESVVYDLHWTALQIGTLTCLFNASARSDASWTLRAWRSSLQDNLQIIQLGCRFFPDIGVSKDVTDGIEETYQRFSALKRPASELISATSRYSPQQRRELGEQGQHWRELCRTTIAALRALEPETQQRLEDIHVANGRILIKFLQEVCDGTTRLVNEWGEIQLPQLVQRRRTPRRTIQQECRVIINGRSSAASIHDVSLQGIGIQSSTSFDVGQDLEIALQDGRKLKAMVAWRNANRVGLKLHKPLGPHDPLLA
ncbi:MAG: PilZ domain-containing protein [Hyphomicrobium sp.]